MRYWHSEAPTWWTELTLPTGRVELTVEATDAAAACEVALRDHPRYDVTEARIVESRARYDAQGRPEPQDLMGFAGIAELLGITVEEAHEVAEHRNFPPPQLAIGTVYTAASVRMFKEHRWS